MSDTYTLTLNREQAQLLLQACETVARLGIGQFRDALEWLPTVEYMPSGWREDMEVIGSILAKYTKDGVDGWHRSHSIRSDKVHEQAKIAWDLYQIIRYRLAWDHAIEEGIVKPGEPRKWPEMMGVHYDNPMKTSKGPMATMEKEGRGE